LAPLTYIVGSALIRLVGKEREREELENEIKSPILILPEFETANNYDFWNKIDQHISYIKKMLSPKFA